MDFFNARASNLNAGLKNFKELQEKAVFLERAAAKAEARKLVGEDGQVFRPKPKGDHCYRGEILKVTDTHAIQRFSANAVYIHDLRDFPSNKTPSVGDVLAIRYSNARIEFVEPISDKTQAKVRQQDLGR